MGFDPASLGMQAAENVINTAMGLALEGHNDRRQLRQQGRLLEQQADVDRRQMDYQRQLNLQMWKDTNFGAQVAETKK